MKKIICILCLLYAADLFATSPYDSISKKFIKSIKDVNSPIAVMPFDSGNDPSTGDAAANEMIASLSSMNAIVVERRNMDKIMEELSLQQTGLVDKETATKVGKSLGAKYLVTGTVKEFNRPGFTNVGLKVQARLVDVESGKIIASENTEVEKSDITPAYKRREAAGSLNYPAMLGLTFGMNYIDNYFTGSREVEDGNSAFSSEDERVNLNGSGYEIGLQYFPQKQNFFGSLWEIYYCFGEFSKDNDEWEMKGGMLSWSLILRIPLWRIFDGLSFLTHLYAGPGFGYGYYVYEPENDAKSDFTLHRFFINVKAGLVIGISDNIALNTQYTYNPDSVSGGIYISEYEIGNNTYLGGGQGEINGHELHVSIVFTP